MTGFFSSKPKLINELDDKQIKKTIVKEMEDHKSGLGLDAREQMVKEGNTCYYNTILNTAAYDSLIQSGTFLSLDTDMQLKLSNLYQKIKHRNKLLDVKLKDLKNQLNEKELDEPHTTTAIHPTQIPEGAGTTIVTNDVTVIKPNAGLHASLLNIKKEIVEYEESILSGVYNILMSLSNFDIDDD